MKKQCEAFTPGSTYTSSHRCRKTQKLRLVGKRSLCAHHLRSPSFVRAAPSEA